ncbi:MAG: trehalose-6-phosphate synthase [Rhodocyclaceae bacterium]|nr:trehalose-6-phosphate synthase [Rhodocyclaceae bacterium]
MRLWLRFIIPLALALTAVAYAVVPLVDQLTLKWFVRDLDARSSLIANTLQDPLQELIRDGARGKILAVFNKLTHDERLYAVGFCEAAPGPLLATPNYPPELGCNSLDAILAKQSPLLPSTRGLLHVSVQTLRADDQELGRLVLVHDMSFIQRRSEETRHYVFYLFIGLFAVVSVITGVIAQLSWRGWVAGTRAIMRGEGLLWPVEKVADADLQPIARDLRSLIRDLEAEYRVRDEAQVTWNPPALRTILREDLRGDEIMVISNREPYIHVRNAAQGIEVQRPASGLVTALEPVMRACSGTWIAHGSGAADRDVVDAHDRIAIPPEQPSYQLRRIWLSHDEEAGYYSGFANEGLWPLCHIAHVRPTFRASDWKHYTEVNRKFARAAVEEAKKSDPIILVQDYHLALLPRMIRERLPEATIITFWHIPWPNPETFSICPWRAELLDGLLGSSIMGFHTQFHCNNFFDTVDRLLEARVDRETFTISFGGKSTAVKRYPISIEWPPAEAVTRKGVAECRADVHKRHGLTEDHLVGVGVDRLDYTKGIIERFLAVERLLEQESRWIGNFSFVQIAAPSRSSIGDYQDFEAQVRACAARINSRFGRDDYLPIILKIAHHEPDEVYEYYRAAEVCVVSSLHDGMNLVAKEFAASRDDERGVLILSQFTGAARELPEALIVNPYDIDQCAAALHLALTMPLTEQRDRMRIMRTLIREFNVYRWAGRMLLDAAGMRKRGRLTVSEVASRPRLVRLAGRRSR